MNRKGQTLIVFILLLPLLFLFAAVLIDVGLITAEKNKLSGTTEVILRKYGSELEVENLENNIKNSFKENQIPAENLKITKTENSLEIENKYTIKSIFGSIIGIKEYSISTHKKIVEENGELKLQKE